MNFSKKHCNKAFTLAEVLVSMAIIGVVASLTIPSIVKNHQKQTWITGYKSAYSIINQAVKTIIADNNGVMPILSASDLTVYEGFKPYLKVAKTCEHVNPLGDCLASGYKYLSGGAFNSFGYASYSLVTTNGMSIFFMGDSTGVNVYLWVDINGRKGPNTSGKDLHQFIVYNTGEVKPNGWADPSIINSYCPSSLTCAGCNGYTCGVRIMRGDYGEDY